LSKHAAVVALCLWPLLADALGDIPPVHAHPKHKKHSAAVVVPAPIPDTRGTEDSPLVVKGAIDTSLPPIPTPEAIAAEKEKAADDHATARGTVWLAILTAVLAVIALFQLWLFLRQLRLTEKAARDAEMAANAAKASADVLPKIERAYVFVEVIVSSVTLGERDNLYELDITVRFTNHGKTPAILSIIRAYPQWSGTPPQQLLPTSRANQEIPDGLVIGAEGHFDVDLPQSFAHEGWVSLVNGGVYIYVIGRVEYKDVMGNEHHTGFCWQVRSQADGVKATIFPSALNTRN
jgi:hypothetical protein